MKYSVLQDKVAQVLVVLSASAFIMFSSVEIRIVDSLVAFYLCRFQKYQQQQQARHGHSSTQSQQQQQQYKQQLNALEQLQKHQQLQQLQQQLQMHQQQFQQQQQLQPHIEAHNTLLPADTPPLQDHTPPPQQFFRSNGQQEMIIHQQQVDVFLCMVMYVTCWLPLCNPNQDCTREHCS